MTQACPSRLVLEEYLLHPERVADGTHIRACAECQQRLDAGTEAIKPAAPPSSGDGNAPPPGQE